MSTIDTTGVTNKIATPKAAMVVAASAATLGLIYGYDNGNIGGAALSFSKDLNLNTDQVSTVTTAIVWGELIGAFFGGWISNKLGRKKAILIVAAGYLVFCLTSAMSFSEGSLWISRFFLGLTIGLSLIAVPLFVAESVPARVRGRTLVLYQVMGVIGIIAGNLFSAALSEANPNYNWRLMLGLAALPALILLPILMRLPETPNWLLMKGRKEEAAITLAKSDPEVDTAPALAEMQATLDEESGGAIRAMFRKPYLRATVFVLVLGFFIQITGINATVTYGPQLFKSMGFDSDVDAILMSAFVQCFALAAVICSMKYIDRWGRRPILMTGISIMIVGLLLCAGTFATVSGETFTGIQQVAGFTGLALINIGFVFGFGSLVWVYASEAFPGNMRAYGTTAVLTADLAANVIIAQYTLPAIEAFGQITVFLAFAVLSFAALAFVAKFAPETKGRQLDDIRYFWENGGKWPTSGIGSAGYVAPVPPASPSGSAK